MITVKRRIEVRRSGRGKRVLVEAETAPPPVPEARKPGVPRVARLMAIAIGLEGRIREGLVRDQSALARELKVSQPRMTQIMNLTLLAPEIQEQVLSMPPVSGRSGPVNERTLRRIAKEPCWSRQVAMWRRIAAADVSPERGRGTQTKPDRAVS